MDIEKLLKALDNDDNQNMINFNSKKIFNMKKEILTELMLTKDEILDLLDKLDDYMYMDEVNELKYGAFIRWIPIIDPNKIKLTTGGVICNIKVMDDGICVVCKNFMGRYYQFKMDECLVFQKLSDQEKVLLSALDHLSK